jgi:hypothetical protein
MVTAFASAYPIGRFGQKKVLLWGTISICFTLSGIMIAGYLNIGALVIAFLILYLTSFQLSFGPIAFMHPQETCPDVAIGIVN